MERVAFLHDIVPTPVSAPYRLGLVVVAVAMLLLPAIYLALIAGTVWFMFWYLFVVGPSVLPGSLSLMGLLVYFGPPFAAGVLAFFLVKPVLASRAGSSGRVLLQGHEAPALFDLIEQICRQVRAPVPKLVQVDCLANASASFLPGPLSMVRRDLVLTIGLPLVSVLSVREFGGVLAHELGHFAQGGGLRLTWIVRSINAWFFRVVYQRDRWDRKLKEAKKDTDGRFVIMVLLADLCVWLSRRALAGLMNAAHVVSCFLLRQMEFDADSYEIKLSGSDAFVRTMARIGELNAAVQFAYHDLAQSRVLPVDLPQFILEKRRHLPSEIREAPSRRSEATTGAFDTHPSDADRIGRAEAAGDAGAMAGGDESAMSLFRDFHGVSATATRRHYEHDLRIEVNAHTLVGTAEVLRDGEERREQAQVLNRVFGGRVSLYRPLRLALDEVEGLAPADLLKRLNESRRAMGGQAEKTANAYRRYEWLADRRLRAFCAEELLQAGLKVVHADQFDLAVGSLDDAQSTQGWAADEQRVLVPDLDRFEHAASMRLTCALRLASTSDKSIHEDALRQAFNAVADALLMLGDVIRDVTARHLLQSGAPAASNTPTVPFRVDLLHVRIDKTLTALRSRLGDIPHPMPREGATTLAASCGFAADVPAVDVDLARRSLTSLYTTLLGRMAVIVERVESSVAA